MQQSNESSPKEKIKPAESNQRSRIVKQRARGFLYQPALFQKTVLHQVSQTLALRDLSQNLIQRRAPFQRRKIHFAEHGLQNLRGVAESDFLAIQVFGGAQREILHQKQINLVAIRCGLFLFPELPL